MLYRLRCFGYPALEDAEGVPTGLVEKHPKLFAVLVYLACRGSEPRADREALLPIFWPSADEAHARNALRQTVHSLRKVLGPRVLPGRGEEELSIDASLLSCDLWEFRSHVRNGRWREACDVGSPIFLENYGIRNEGPFMDWVDRLRYELRSQVANAWSRVATEAETQGDLLAASRSWDRALDFAPYDETFLRAMIRTLAATGDRAQASAAYDRFTRRLRTPLELDPSPATVSAVRALLS